MWQSLHAPQLQAPIFVPSLLIVFGILAIELPQEVLALVCGVLIIAKPNTLVMVLFIGLGIARMSCTPINIHEINPENVLCGVAAQLPSREPIHFNAIVPH